MKKLTATIKRELLNDASGQVLCVSLTDFDAEQHTNDEGKDLPKGTTFFTAPQDVQEEWLESNAWEPYEYRNAGFLWNLISGNASNAFESLVRHGAMSKLPSFGMVDEGDTTS